jgi:hypothetical protein
MIAVDHYRSIESSTGFHPDLQPASIAETDLRGLSDKLYNCLVSAQKSEKDPVLWGSE